MSPEKALDLRAKVADYRRTGVGMLDPVMDAFIDLLDGKETLPEETATLRDDFAMAALNAILTTTTTRTLSASELAEATYRLADAMLEARKVPDEE